MRYKIQLINAYDEIVDESASPLSAEEAIRLIGAYESIASRPTMRAADAMVCPACKEPSPSGKYHEKCIP